MSYLKFLVQELSNLKLNCEFWDVRIEDSVDTQIILHQNAVTTCSVSPSVGAFLRVRKKGFWLYQSTTQLDEIKNSLLELVKTNSPEIKYDYDYKHPFVKPYLNVSSDKNKFCDISIDDKVTLLKHYSDFASKIQNVNSIKVVYRDKYKIKSYLNSVGTQFEYDFNSAGFNIGFNLKNNDNLFDDRIHFYASRFSELQNKENEIQNYIQDSQAFLTAPSVTPGKYKILMDSHVAGVFTHESFGHKSEADFMLGGASALEDWKIGKKIASECLSIVDQGDFENTSGWCPIDDEGIPAQKNYLIKNGILQGRLHSVETSLALNEKPTGNGRALNFEFEPIVRMTSTFIEPGEDSIDSILEKSEGSLLVQGVKHGSGLSTFTIAPTRGYLIGKSGSKTPVRVTVISGSVFETLNNIEAVSKDFELQSVATGGCGKMMQGPLPVADGGPYVLVRDMQVS